MSLSSVTPWLENLGAQAKVVAAITAAVTGILGVPVAYFLIRKTRIEIRKLELENAALERAADVGGAEELPASINITDVNGGVVNISIVYDPRLRGPLLLLLDFFIVWVVLTLVDYALGSFFDGPLAVVVAGILAALLLIPILREALHLKRILKASKEVENE